MQFSEAVNQLRRSTGYTEEQITNAINALMSMTSPDFTLTIYVVLYGAWKKPNTAGYTTQRMDKLINDGI